MVVGRIPNLAETGLCQDKSQIGSSLAKYLICVLAYSSRPENVQLSLANSVFRVSSF